MGDDEDDDGDQDDDDDQAARRRAGRAWPLCSAVSCRGRALSPPLSSSSSLCQVVRTPNLEDQGATRLSIIGGFSSMWASAGRFGTQDCQT